MCPIVPMLTCGLLRSNFSFAISVHSPALSQILTGRLSVGDLSLRPADNLFGDRSRSLFVPAEVHRETAAALSARPDFGRISEHLRQRHHRPNHLTAAAQLDAFQPPAAADQIAVD